MIYVHCPGHELNDPRPLLGARDGDYRVSQESDGTFSVWKREDCKWGLVSDAFGEAEWAVAFAESCVESDVESTNITN